MCHDRRRETLTITSVCGFVLIFATIIFFEVQFLYCDKHNVVMTELFLAISSHLLGVRCELTKSGTIESIFAELEVCSAL